MVRGEQIGVRGDASCPVLQNQVGDLCDFEALWKDAWRGGSAGRGAHIALGTQREAG